MSELTKTTGKNKKWGGNILLWIYRANCISLVMHAIKRHLNCKWVQTENCETGTHKHAATHFQLDSSKHSLTQITSSPLGLNLLSYSKKQSRLRLSVPRRPLNSHHVYSILISETAFSKWILLYIWNSCTLNSSENISTFHQIFCCFASVLQTMQSTNQCVVAFHDFGHGCQSVWLSIWFLHKVRLTLTAVKCPYNYCSLKCLTA